MSKFKAVSPEQYAAMVQEVGVTRDAIKRLLKDQRQTLCAAGYNAAEVSFIVDACDPDIPVGERFRSVVDALP